MQISQLLVPLLALCASCHLACIAAQAQCGVGDYDLSCLSTTDFNTTSPLELGYVYIFRPCGTERSFLPCGRIDSTNVMLCQWWASTAANSTLNYNYSIALWNASALSWSTLTDDSNNYIGIGFTVSNGDGGGCGGGIPHRTAVVSFYCDPSNSQAFSINGDIEGSCSYYYSLNTSLVCPGMTRSCSTQPSSSSLPSGAVAAIVIVVLLTLAALTAGLLLWRRRRGRASGDGPQNADGQYDNTSTRFRPLH